MRLTKTEERGLRNVSDRVLGVTGRVFGGGGRVVNPRTVDSLRAKHLVYEHAGGYLELTRKGEVELGRRS